LGAKKGTLAGAGLTEQAATTKHAATTAFISQTSVIWLPLPHWSPNGDRRHLMAEINTFQRDPKNFGNGSGETGL
jgi:hypothetical protein